jgi:cytochrome c-type biogenesis protein CcmH
MTLWLILALMTAAAVFAVIWPLARHAGAARSGSDIVVYRDQLDEVERDLAAGLIGKTEAEAARVEISRRLLAAADTAQATPPAFNATSAAWRRRAVAVASVLALPIVAGGLYLWLGSPELASAQPVAQRNVVPAQQSVESLVAQAEARLQRNPNDGRGWEILAPVYMRLDRYSDSVTAWRNALQLLGENAERDANLGEALTAEANGVVTADAKAAFVRAMKLDDTIVSARYYLGLAAEQDGQGEQAAKIWRDLIAEAPAGATWVSEVRNALARVEAGTTPPSQWQVGDVRNALGRVESTSTSPPPGPSAAQMAAAANQPPEQQAATIQNMVDGLAARLKQDGSDLDGWVRLVRSYKVLGEPDKATAAAADAQHAFAGDPDKLQQLNAALKQLDAGNATAPAAAPGPTTAQMTDAADQPPEQQDASIRGMVDRLAARLKQDGSDVDGWVQLERSYRVLGEPDKATAAAADARQALAGDAGKLQQLNTALKELDAGNAGAPNATPVPGAAPAAAAAPPDHQQGATIENMVERLAARLKISGSDPAGWLMLARSYMTLGEKDKATAAISDARQALAGDPDKLDQFNQALKQYKIGE